MYKCQFQSALPKLHEQFSLAENCFPDDNDEEDGPAIAVAVTAAGVEKPYN
jgi:hypothetical protein